jgi:ketosteroid isomerase-like protein
MNKYLQYLLFFCVAVSMIVSCTPSIKKQDALVEKERLVLLKVDNDFAALSVNKSMKNAYLEYIDSNGVLLRPNSLPIVSAEAVDYIIALKDTGYNIEWKPSKALVARSLELGYTYGVYKIEVPASGNTFYGTYVTIWKKQADGKWKFILQSNNEGVSEEE